MVRVPKPEIKKKEKEIDVKGIYHNLSSRLLDWKRKIKEIETEIAKKELKRKTEKEREFHLREQLKKLKEKEREIKIEEEKFKAEIINTLNKEQRLEKQEKKLEKQEKELKEKILGLKQAIEKELL